MKGDFTSLNFQADNHYSSVRLQQGRVQLDADWNEQIDIAAHRDETTATDVVGREGGPLHAAGFAVTAQAGNLVVGAGRYYVDGILCENEAAVTVAAEPAVANVFGQPDLPGVPLPGADGTYLAYLDVWQRHLTALEAPAIREEALGGPDTCTRTKVVWQVKLENVSSVPGVTCGSFPADWIPTRAASTGRLRAQAQPSAIDEGPCIIPAGAGFRRLENQLYRVEIHADSAAAGGPTFKWSRDNGIVLARLENIVGNDLIIADPGKDASLGFASGQWVELSDEGRTLRGEPGVLVELASAQGTVLTVSAWPNNTPLTLASFGAGPSVRRWDSESAAAVTTGAFVALESGVQVEFAAGGEYRTGDYWLIPARSLTGTVQWPRSAPDAQGQTTPLFETRHGTAHHFCRLALLQRTGGVWSALHDCRTLFPPLTEVSALHYVGGDGQEAMPDLSQPAATIPLARPLEVGVANLPGARVRFAITLGGGRLNGVASPVDVLTDAEGVARCTWQLDSTLLSQQVSAHLLDAALAPLSLPVHFNANLSVASQVAFDDQLCRLNVRTVQRAIEALCGQRVLRYVSGDGQEGPANTAVPGLLIVGVEDGAGRPVPNAQVTFAVEQGGGIVRPVGGNFASSVTIATDDPAGLARCEWRLGSDPTVVNIVRATLAGAPQGNPLPVIFRGVIPTAPLWPRVARISWANDRPMTAAQFLANGLTVDFSEPMHPATASLDTFVVTVELAEADPAGAFAGHRSHILQGVIEAQGPTWRFRIPPAQATAFPPAVARWLGQESTLFASRRLRCRVVLKGNTILDERGTRPLDGNTIGRLGPIDPLTNLPTTDLRLPSGDGTIGGDFESWFYLEAPG